MFGAVAPVLEQNAQNEQKRLNEIHYPDYDHSLLQH